MSKGFSIAIDGPVASGKGTVAAALAVRLGGFFINTGAMYRAVALVCSENGIDVNSENKVSKILPKVNFDFKDNEVFLNGANVTVRLTKPDVSKASSIVATYPSVRVYLVKKQRKIVEDILNRGKMVVAEGRDTGTKVIPSASLKIFLTASLKTRAKRRLNQYGEKGVGENIKDVIEDTKTRDKRDMERDIDPLSSNPSSLGYWVLDNSNQTKEQTLGLIIKELKRRGLIDD